MNCRRFQNRLYEYVEGTLSPRTQAAADQHLARCNACRQAMHQEQQLARVLCEGLRHDTGTLALRPGIRQRILTVLEHTSAPPTAGEIIAGLWKRYARPVVIAVFLLLIVAFLRIQYLSGTRVPETGILRSDGRDIRSAVSIEVSYCVPTYRFHQEGNFVVDTLSCVTMVANETLWTGAQEPVKTKQERKMPL